ncbi:MAG: class I SAM-dependent methyltransferase [Lachnospiraceae bacterium]|nr:class I SAM-dependent methyltransferase [Lachnospiraceae bacterium]
MKYNFELDLIFNNSLALIAKQIKRASSVLEFGPANGRLTKYMKEQLSCNVFLVELDEEAGKEAADYGSDIVFGDIESFTWVEKYNGKKFDYIIFADVLEHLKDPENVLVKAKMFLEQEGSMLISVPNIAHNSILINLLKGKFDYTTIGLLDNTHIRFFTKNSLENMLFRLGLEPVKKMATYNEVGNNEIENDYRDIPELDESFWKYREYGNVYQFVYEVKNGIEYVDNRHNSLKKFLKPYFIQCYIDFGEGYSEESVMTSNITQLNGDVQFEFEINDTIKGFRVDPLNKECIIEDYLCEIKSDGAWSALTYEKTNADAIEAGQYYFFNRDSWFKYTAPFSKIEKIRIKMKIVTMDIHTMNLIYETMIKMKNTMLAETRML